MGFITLFFDRMRFRINIVHKLHIRGVQALDVDFKVQKLHFGRNIKDNEEVIVAKNDLIESFKAQLKALK